jgi:hypothetical protein
MGVLEMIAMMLRAGSFGTSGETTARHIIGNVSIWSHYFICGIGVIHKDVLYRGGVKV